MKKVSNILNLFSAIILGLTPILLVVVLGVIFYKDDPSTTIVVVFSIIGLLSLLIGYKIFRMINKNGLLKFITNLYASPELDKKEDIE